VISNTPTARPDGYEEFFGFSDPPFSLSANPRFRFPSAAHEEALSQVMYALQRREPVVVVTGDIGLGKTLLCRTVLERLPRKTFLAIIDDPLLGPDDLLKEILEDFGVISAENAGAIRASRHELVDALHTFLASLAPLDAHAVVVIDEAQHVQPDVLEQIRLLANTSDGRGTLLQIVLVGQPSLHMLLAKPELQQLRQRITRSVSLSALTEEEVKQYIAHRLAVARESATDSRIPGAHDLARAIAAWNESSRPVTFTEDAIAAAARVSHGVPRLVNVVCDRALEVAFEQRSRTVDAVTVDTAAQLVPLAEPVPETVREAVPETTASIEVRETSRTGRYVAAVAVVALVIAAGTLWFATRARDQAPVAEPRAAEPSTPPPHASSVPTPAAVPAPASAPPPTTPDSAPVTPTAGATPNPSNADASAATDESFEIVVASFRTDAKAAEVVDRLTEFGQRVHQRSVNGWHQVVVGPFASKAAAEDAQRELDRKGVTGTLIARASR
jgi:general secretion pathway protein A